MRPLRRIGVFCGSSSGARPEYREAAVDLARFLAAEGIGLVYGGANLGTMGLLAETMQNAGGDVIGVIPQSLVDKEIARRELADLRIVGSMHERKALMADLSDAVIALPGGLGTLDELFETLTWNQLDLQQKPCGLLNVAGFYDGLIAFLSHAVRERFLRPEHAAMLRVANTPDALIEELRHFEPPRLGKWF
ncbi:MAG: TIGR00730 family Rossman fold protein [Capsulimonadales bacterium]|nr:TIGR00730 family Rossman fold protein [Capsulimonadales bacterium]